MKLTHDACHWWKKWSTWLAVVAAMSAGGLGAYTIAPGRAQELVPDWALGVLVGAGILSAMLIPLATSIAQRSIPKPGEGE